MIGYGPSLLDLGYDQGDLDEAYLRNAEAHWRNENRTGWALPTGLENDLRAHFHYFNGGNFSLCGKHATPWRAIFDDAPPPHYSCKKCKHRAPRPGFDLPADHPARPVDP